uniref:Nuclear receptor domain-containing protein n=1 Tax=Steinernema glaseri TaxID=37863 RepID=A0A1I8AL68_9BILA
MFTPPLNTIYTIYAPDPGQVTGPAIIGLKNTISCLYCRLTDRSHRKGRKHKQKRVCFEAQETLWVIQIHV